jgi:hypothetical protein
VKRATRTQTEGNRRVAAEKVHELQTRHDGIPEVVVRLKTTEATRGDVKRQVLSFPRSGVEINVKKRDPYYHGDRGEMTMRVAQLPTMPELALESVDVVKQVAEKVRRVRNKGQLVRWFSPMMHPSAQRKVMNMANDFLRGQGVTDVKVNKVNLRRQQLNADGTASWTIELVTKFGPYGVDVKATRNARGKWRLESFELDPWTLRNIANGWDEGLESMGPAGPKTPALSL